MKQRLTARLGKRQTAEFVQNDEVPPGEIFGDPLLAAAPRLRFEPVDEIDGVVEAAIVCRRECSYEQSLWRDGSCRCRYHR